MGFTELPHVLDGYRILNRAPATSPTDVYMVNVSAQNLKILVRKDMLLFTHLRHINCSQNNLRMEDFVCFTTLKSLSLACNNIDYIHRDCAIGLPQLQELDLSFNRLSEDDVAVLAALPSLKKLDLSENGLKSFPLVIKNMNEWWSWSNSESKIPGFLNLEYLNLDGNLISNDSFFDAISVVPNLKVLKLNHNKIKSFAFLNEPTDPSSSLYLGLQELEELEIAYNCIDTANGLMGIARLPKLKQVALAGNAVLKDASTVQLKDDDIGTIELDPVRLLTQHYGIHVLDFKVSKSTPKKKANPLSAYVAHQIEEIKRPSKLSLRREYEYSESDIGDMIKMGRILSLRELIERKKGKGTSLDPIIRPKSGNDPSMPSESSMDQVQGAEFGVEYRPDAKDDTFLTSVHITDKPQKETNFEPIHLDFSPNREKFNMPNSLQASLRALRYALHSCGSIVTALDHQKSKKSERAMEDKLPINDGLKSWKHTHDGFGIMNSMMAHIETKLDNLSSYLDEKEKKDFSRASSPQKQQLKEAHFLQESLTLAEQTISSLEESLEQSQQEIKKLKKEKMELENVILDKDICIQEQKKDHEQRKKELLSQLNKSEAVIQDWFKKYSDLESEMEINIHQLNEKNASLEELKKQHESFKQELEAELITNRDEFKELQKESELKSHTIDSLESQIQQLFALNEALREEMNEPKEEGRERQISNVPQINSSFADEMISTSNAANEAKIKALEEELATLTAYTQNIIGRLMEDDSLSEAFSRLHTNKKDLPLSSKSEEKKFTWNLFQRLGAQSIFSQPIPNLF